MVGGKIVIFQSFQAYSKLFRENSNMGKHEMLGKAVVEAGLSPMARTAYESLKSSSFTARYSDYRVRENLAAHAISKLDIVEKECQERRARRDMRASKGNASI